ncbi:MAG: nucleic acid-binding protein [Syntrophaceticus schinkii]|jgi:predicted nucleic-acid-binding Zn-ribbon protein|nr:nucleic acid-binding protein [Syntrophaceticus schinkii]
MARKCLRCGEEMIENCQANISGSAQYIAHISKKDGFLKKVRSNCNVAVCSKCGYLEFYIEEPHKFVSGK